MHERGFVLVSTRSPDIQRMYFQCSPTEKLDGWSASDDWHGEQTTGNAADKRSPIHHGRTSSRSGRVKILHLPVALNSVLPDWLRPPSFHQRPLSSAMGYDCSWPTAA